MPSPLPIVRILSSLAALILGALVICPSAACLGASAKRAGEKPNVLLIFSDDLCNQLGTYGHKLVKSPNLDRLAARGVRFDRAYCQWPLCNPSRASIMTGMLPDQTGVHENQTHFRKQLPDHVTLPQHFQHHGYQVARVGKIYHYGVPGQIGTDGFDDKPSWQKVVNPRGYDKDHEKQAFSIIPGNLGRALSWLEVDTEDDVHTDGKVASEAIKLLKQYQDKPFFLAVGFFRPHTPYIVPRKYFEMYPIESIKLPAKVQKDRADIPAMALYESRHAYRGHDNMTNRQRREAIRAYYAATTFMDAQLGKVLDAVEQLGLNDNTIIVFASDHGFHLYEHGLWHKRTLFEESARVPLVIAAPGMDGKGKACERVAELIDLYPTLADLCGLPIPEELPGISLKPQLDDPTLPTKEAALTQVRRGNGIDGYSIRTERWRYTQWDDGKQGVELYDHQTDPHEFTNLAEQPGHADTVRQLKALLTKQRNRPNEKAIVRSRNQ